MRGIRTASDIFGRDAEGARMETERCRRDRVLRVNTRKSVGILIRLSWCFSVPFYLFCAFCEKRYYLFLFINKQNICFSTRHLPRTAAPASRSRRAGFSSRGAAPHCTR